MFKIIINNLSKAKFKNNIANFINLFLTKFHISKKTVVTNMYDFFVDVLRVFDNHLKAILISLR